MRRRQPNVKPSVLFVFEGYGPGGDFGVCLDLCKLLTQRGHRCKLISRSDDIDDMLRSRAEAFGLEIGLFKELSDCLTGTSTNLSDYDVVHVHYPGNYLPAKLGIPYRRLFGKKPILLTLHGPVPVDQTCRSLRQRISGWAAAKCVDAVAVPSKHKLEELEATRMFGSKLHCLPNPVRALPETDKAEARRALGLPLDAPICLWVGRIGPEKSPEILLRAIPRIALKGKKPILAFAGPDYGIEGEIKELLATHADSVRLLGYLPEPAVAYAACDMVVVTSRYESFSLVLFEAASAARAIVAPDLPIVKKVFQGFKAVSVYPWGDSDALADRVAERIQAPAACDEKAMQTSIMSEFGYEAALAKHLAVYEDLIRRHGSAN
jgi:glycosyltransferase involved in cell wall biosynthesis